jgi:ATP-dependent helicase/nuclease subunit B
VQARFLLGPAGSGKTFRCLAEIRAALVAAPAGRPLVLLAPKQATFQLERQLLADPSLNGYTRLHIFSFERLAQFVLDRLELAPPQFLSDEGRVMVLRALLLRHAGELKLYRGSARRPGFAQELGSLLNELQQHQVTPAKLRRLARRDELPSELRGKLHDLALLSEKYADWLRDHRLQDGNHLLDFATAILRQKTLNAQLSTLNFSGLWLDGFAEMTPQELDLLAAVVPACDRATLAFCLDESGPAKNSWLSIWNAVGKSFQQCKQRLEDLPNCEISTELLKRDARKNRFTAQPALQCLEACWQSGAGFQPAKNRQDACSTTNNAVRIITCSNAETEAIFTAREILKFVRAGNRFRDCAVLVRNLDSYHQPLARTFRRHDIPFFLDRRESVAQHPLAELTRGALRTIVFDWQPDDWFAALKAGFSPVKEEQIDALENTALAFGWRGEKWRAPLPDETSESLRKIIFPPFENFLAQLNHNKFRPAGPQLAEALRGLWHDLKVEPTLERWTSEDEKSAVRRPPSAIHATVRDQMNAWLENLALAFADEPLPLRDWLPVLEAGLANLTVGVVPPALDQVLIGAVDRARNPDLKLALVMGVNETLFPATPAAQTILTDADRDELTISLGPDLRERLAREHYYGYIACTRAREKLVVTCSRHDAAGNSLNPSPFIAHLQQIFPGLETEQFSGEIKLTDAQHVNEIAPVLMAVQPERRPPARQAGDVQRARAVTEAGVPPPFADEAAKTWNELLTLPALAELMKSLDALHEPDASENLSPVFAEKLYSSMLRTSVSRLEEFAACPFRFFVRSGLRADERKIFELDARERGSFQHDVLKTFHEQLMAEGKRWRDLASDEARARVGKIAAGLTENYRDGLLRDTAESRFAARAMAESLQDFVAVIVTWLREQNEFDPAAAELAFDDKPDASAPAWEINLGGGHRLALRGRIDRVDLWRDPAGGGARALVLDYKSSSKKLDKILVENGVQLQLLAYLNVLQHWKNPQAVLGVNRLIPAGVFYVNLRGEYKSGGTRTEILADAGEARRKAYRHTGRFDAKVLDRLDRAGAADQFNYRRNNDGSLRKGSVEAMPRVEFEKLLGGVEMQLRKMGESIFSGAAQVDPYRKGRQTPCEFCDYSAACRIDKWTHQYRPLRAVSAPGG